MIEIIPNWHPIFVHFTVALFTTSVGLYWLAYLTSRFQIIPKIGIVELEISARWCLWIGAFITIITVLAGLNAFDTVKHDAISHVAMYEHRNWALPTATAILLVAAWSIWRYFHDQAVTMTFVVVILLVQASLLSTAWHGSELVYRYGLGVMSLPNPEGFGHHHHPDEEIQPNSSNISPPTFHEHHHDSDE